ncbi:MAG: beta-glucuronidase [Epulopiscium sp.]|nr:beta-glucuronidase [Candidatus Epulonipiscium sp.]
MGKIDLKGTWNFCLDSEKMGLDKKYYKKSFEDTIDLPTTVSESKKGSYSDKMNVGFLTDPYYFEGYTWYSKDVEFEDTKEKEFFLILERTRISHLWIDENYIGSNDSLCTSHRYRITPYISNKSKITIMVDNTSYLIKGGHMTSPDTQTNWNGITGEIYIEELNKAYLSKVRIYPNVAQNSIEVKLTLNGSEKADMIAWTSCNQKAFSKSNYELLEGENTFTYYLDKRAQTWSEHNPQLYDLILKLKQNNETEDEYRFSFGLREFKAKGKYFEINGMRTFLRGKHDGLIFPLTGYAPTDVEEWIKILKMAKEYGINHYRFHTCCPPRAAFIAADILGMYMEPELPFWGIVTQEGEENHDETGQKYLIEEGFRILDEFGNHPSFVMMSMGNELWGSKNRINQILGDYRKYDNRHLYTQGSNNFQFMPCILENEDFFCGVRFSRDRLFRGSYAMCDAPQGHIQTMAPNTSYNYDEIIRPSNISEGETKGGNITIQYGTSTKTVKMDSSGEIIPEVPVVSHEIGQYAMYPDFSEVNKYLGVLKPRNFEIFKNRLEEKNMLHMADEFFKASGKLAVECYKLELETALRSNELAGYQILDLQDFSGQGTALVGILDAFMESKGLISSKEWRQFCYDKVILGELNKFIFTSEEMLIMPIKLACFNPKAIINPKIEFNISEGEHILISKEKTIRNQYFSGMHKLTDFKIKLPKVLEPKKLTLTIKISEADIKNAYDIWIYPQDIPSNRDEDIIITESIEEARKSLKEGKKVLYYPQDLDDMNSIEGTYCTDFWCYPMFKSISKSMGKPVPVGTLGLCIQNNHPIFNNFPTESHTTPQWYDIITNSRAMILDGENVEPIVWVVDNFERNHKLGIIYELTIEEGKLLVCTSNLRRIKNSHSAKWLEYSIIQQL